MLCIKDKATQRRFDEYSWVVYFMFRLYLSNAALGAIICCLLSAFTTGKQFDNL